MRSILAGAAVLAGGALLVAGCSSGASSSSSSSSASSAASSGSASAAAASAPVTVRLGYLANITHAPALIGVKKGYFAKELGKDGHAEDHGVHHRDRGDHRDPGRPARRRLRRPEPGDQRLAEVQRQGHQDHLRRRHRRGVRRGASRPSPAPRSSRARRSPRRRSATPRTSRCATGSSSRGWPPARPAAATSRSSRPRRTPPPCSSSSPARSPAAGSPRPTTSRWCRTAARCCCQRAGRRPPTARGHPVVPGRAPGHRQRPAQGADRGATLHQVRTRRGAEQAANDELDRLHRQAAVEPSVLRPGVQGDHLHQRPDRVLADRRTRSTPSRSGLLKPVDLSGIYDLGPLNELLKAAGEPQVSRERDSAATRRRDHRRRHQRTAIRTAAVAGRCPADRGLQGLRARRRRRAAPSTRCR